MRKDILSKEKKLNFFQKGKSEETKWGERGREKKEKRKIQMPFKSQKTSFFIYSIWFFSGSNNMVIKLF